MRLSSNRLLRKEQGWIIKNVIWLLAALAVTAIAVFSTITQQHWLAQSLLWAFGPVQIIAASVILYIDVRNYREDVRECRHNAELFSE